jgi:hypothetical protein
LLLKGSIVVKKAYCDWDRYKGFKSSMHEANFELIEIPHVRQSGKNSADIRMVVDALDLCYTKSHVNTFVIISGDSDFSPLVSKLRENAKKVIGVGVKQSTSDLLVANCDEFIFYDDLVRERRRADAAKRDTREGQGVKRTPEEEKRRREEMDKRRSQAVEMAVETFDALVAERGDSGKIWASVLKEAIKRRKPDFSESYYGFRTFGNLLEEARARGLLDFGRDEKSGAYVYRSSGVPVLGADSVAVVADGAAPAVQAEAAEVGQGRHEGGRRGRNRGRDRRPFPVPGQVNMEAATELQLAQEENAYAQAEAEHAADDAPFVPHPEDAGLEEGGVAADEAVADMAAAADAQSPADTLDVTVAEASALETVDVAHAAAPVPPAEPARRKPQKLPARAAKAAKLKAAQAAAAAQAHAAAETPAVPAIPAADVAEVTVAVVEQVAAETAVQDATAADAVVEAAEPAAKPAAGKGRSRAPAKGRGGKGAPRAADAASNAAADAAPANAKAQAEQPAAASAVSSPAPEATGTAPRSIPEAAAADGAAGEAPAPGAAKPARKPAARGPRRPRKPDAKQGA